MKTLTVAGLSLLLLTLFFQCCPSTTVETQPAETTTIPTATVTPVAAPTQEPTLTLAPIVTDTPVPTNTPEPVLDVYGGYTYVQYDYLHVIGEMLNPTDQWLEYVKIVVTFYDSAGTMIGTDFTYTELDLIPPGDTGAFDTGIDVSTLGGEVDSYELQVQARPASHIPYQDLVAEVSNQYESYGYWHLEGLVRNTGNLHCEYVKIVAAFYDSNDQIVGVDFTYTELDEVSAGSQSPFDLAAADLPHWDHYRIWVQGRPIE